MKFSIFTAKKSLLDKQIFVLHANITGAAQYSQQYPSQQYGQQYGHSTVVVTQPVVPVVVRFHESPMRMKCTFCHADIVTATYYETGTLTWIACVVLCFIG